MPDTRTLADCQIPTFKTHPTPINVMVRSEAAGEEALTKKVKGGKDVDGGSNDLPANVSSTSQGCCTIL
jgi:hypothetical protein